MFKYYFHSIRKFFYLFFILVFSLNCYSIDSKSSQNIKICLWNESLSYLSNVSIATADYEGGTIITEWYDIGNVLQKTQIFINDSKKLENAIIVSVLKNINNLISKDLEESKKIKDQIILSTQNRLKPNFH